MKIYLFLRPIGAFYALLLLLPLTARLQTDVPLNLRQEFNLGGERAQEVQYFIMKSSCSTYAPDGKRSSTDKYTLRLEYEPHAADTGENGRYICRSFSVQLGDSAEVALPDLTDWSYHYTMETDQKNQVFSIDHSRFENLMGSNGRALPFDKAYHVYNAFIDFHAFCNVFADPMVEENGIEDLKKIGQIIVHAAAFSRGATHLGSEIAEGSYFQNGEITLEFKGLSSVHTARCALIGIDSGESSFKMILHPLQNIEIVSSGSSHYKGDIYKDLVSNWVQKVTFDEVVISETVLPMPPHKIDSVVERTIVISNVDRDDFYNIH